MARTVSEFLKETNRFDKTIVFCEDINHAERMRQALVNENGDLCAQMLLGRKRDVNGCGDGG